MGRHDSESPLRSRESPRPSRREHRRDASPVKDKYRVREAEKLSGQESPPGSRGRSLKLERSRSPSPRTKKLRKAQAEKEAETKVDRNHDKSSGKGDDRDKSRVKETKKLSDREYERNYSKGDERSKRREREDERDYERRSVDKNSHRERGADKENGHDKKERRSRTDDVDEKSLRRRHGRSPSPSVRHHKSKRRSRSPQSDVDVRERDEVRNSRASDRRNSDEDEDSLARMKSAEEALEAKQKHQPSFELSGKLAAETNRVRGVTLLFHEPPEARKPDVRWRLYVFKGGEMLNEPLYIHRQSCYLFGRERRVADVPTDHPSCSKQHAVIQFRQVEKEQPDGMMSKQVRPYLMDLGSTNKTFLNESPIEPQRYYELVERDTIKFGNSSREYVLLHENSVT